MRRLRAFAATGLLATLAALAGPLVPASASGSDAAATRIYLHADYALVRAEAEGVPKAIAAIDALAQRLRTQCPAVLANEPRFPPGVPPSASALAVSEEVSDAALGAGARVERRRRRAFANTVAGVHWSDRALARLVHAHASAEAQRAELPTPDLCSDMSVWVASGYATVAAGTASYLRRESALDSEIEGVEVLVVRKLAHFEDATDRHLARRIAELERAALARALDGLLTALGRIEAALH